MNQPQATYSAEKQNRIKPILETLPQILATYEELAVVFINTIVNPILEELGTIPKEADDSTVLHILVKMKWVEWRDIWKPGLAKEINEQDIFGNTPLHYAYAIAHKNNNYSTVTFLQQNGANPELTNDDGYKPHDMPSTE
jgi:ankyrin repeat protein